MIYFILKHLPYVLIALAYAMVCAGFIEECLRKEAHKEAFLTLVLLISFEVSLAMVRFL